MLVAHVLDNGRVMEPKNARKKFIHSLLSTETLAKRADGNPNTHSFVASPEIVTALAIAGDLTLILLPIS
jgi:aconitase A